MFIPSNSVFWLIGQILLFVSVILFTQLLCGNYKKPKEKDVLNIRKPMPKTSNIIGNIQRKQPWKHPVQAAKKNEEAALKFQKTHPPIDNKVLPPKPKPKDKNMFNMQDLQYKGPHQLNKDLKYPYEIDDSQTLESIPEYDVLNIRKPMTKTFIRRGHGSDWREAALETSSACSSEFSFELKSSDDGYRK